MVVFEQMITMAIMLVIGIILFKRGFFVKTTTTDISKLVSKVCNPAIIVFSAINSVDNAKDVNLLGTLVAAVVYYAGLVIISYVIPNIIRANKHDKKFYNVMGVYANVGFIGVPLVIAVMGDGAVIYLAIFDLIFHLLIYTHGIHVLTKDMPGEKLKFDWKKMMNTGTLASILAIVIFAFRIHIPEVPKDVLGYLGHCTTFLAMLVVGVTVAQINVKELFAEKKLYIFILIRFILVPVATIFVLKKFITNQMLLGVIALCLSLPSANLPLMISKEYGLETDLITKGIVVTTLLSIITVTLASVMLGV